MQGTPKKECCLIEKSISARFSTVYPFQVLKDVFMRTYASSRVKRISGGHIGGQFLSTNMAFPQSSTKVREMFRQIAPKPWATKT